MPTLLRSWHTPHSPCALRPTLTGSASAADAPAGPSLGAPKLPAVNLESSLAFYREVLGMQEVARYDSPWPSSRFLQKDLKGGERTIAVALKFGATPEAAKGSAGGTLEIVHHTKDGIDRRPAHEDPDLIINVPSMTDALARARAHKARIVLEPFEVVDKLQLSLVADPSGNILELLGPK